MFLQIFHSLIGSCCSRYYLGSELSCNDVVYICVMQNSLQHEVWYYKLQNLSVKFTGRDIFLFPKERCFLLL